MPSIFDIYRKKTNSVRCSNNTKSNLVNNSAGTTTVLLRRTNQNITVNLIIANKKEGLGTAKIYTFASDGVQVGDYIVWNTNYVFLITDQENNVQLDSNIKKFNARECNVVVQYKNNLGVLSNINAVYIGKTATKMSASLKGTADNPILLLNDKDVLIFAGANLKRFDSCLIGTEQFDVLSFDKITNSSIVYCTIEGVPTTMVQTETAITPTTIIYRAGLQYSFATQDYYFATNETGLKVERQENKVIITMPYNKQSITFNTKENATVKANTISIS